MEVFLWSASGQILLDTLASSYPTVLAYIIDTPRSSSPATFMSNMLYACSVLYKTSLPIVLVCNKTDVKDASFVKEWMTDFEKFQEAVRAERGTDGEEGMGFMGSLMGSMGLVLEEFYHALDVINPLPQQLVRREGIDVYKVVPVSSLTGAGMEDFFKAAAEKKQEYDRDYKPELERRIRERTEEKKTQGLDKLMRDMKVGSPSGAEARKPVHLETISDGEDEGDEDDGFLVDPDPVDDEDETLQEKFVQAARNAQISAEDAGFDKWAREVNRGGI